MIKKVLFDNFDICSYVQISMTSSKNIFFLNKKQSTSMHISQKKCKQKKIFLIVLDSVFFDLKLLKKIQKNVIPGSLQYLLKLWEFNFPITLPQAKIESVKLFFLIIFHFSTSILISKTYYIFIHESKNYPIFKRKITR